MQGLNGFSFRGPHPGKAYLLNKNCEPISNSTYYTSSFIFAPEEQPFLSVIRRLPWSQNHIMNYTFYKQAAPLEQKFVS